MATAKSKTKVKAEVADSPAAPAEAMETTKASGTLVVCAYPGTGEQLSEVWRKMTGEEPVILTVRETDRLTGILAEAVANPEVADEFILAPANCVPCSPVSLDELGVPLVFVDIQGKRRHADRLPVPFTKEALLEALSSSPADQDDEGFMKAYYKANLHRPIEGGFRFGNLVTPVYRSNPCENLVIEAFVRKRFVTASAVGYKAISHLIDQYLLG